MSEHLLLYLAACDDQAGGNFIREFKMRKTYKAAKEADAAYSLAGWLYRLLDFAFPTAIAW
jgi:hypothetical protein